MTVSSEFKGAVAVDKEGEVLDVLIQKHRNKVEALKLLRILLKNQGAAPEAIVTDGLAPIRPQ